MLGQAKKTQMARMYQTTAKLSIAEKTSALGGLNYSQTPGHAGNTSVRKLSSQQRTRQASLKQVRHVQSAAQITTVLGNGVRKQQFGQHLQH